MDTASVASLAEKRIVVVHGPPGAGKGAVAAAVAASLQLAYVSTGDLLRRAIEAGTAAGRVGQGAMEDGSLAADEMMAAMVKERTAHPDCDNGFVLAGFPRTTRQAEMFDSVLWDARDAVTKVVRLLVDDATSRERVLSRWVHAPSNRVYYAAHSPPQSLSQGAEPSSENMLDDATGEALTRRHGDTEECVDKRIAAYTEESEPVYNRYDARVVEVDAARAVPKVVADVVEILGGPSATDTANMDDPAIRGEEGGHDAQEEEQGQEQPREPEQQEESETATRTDAIQDASAAPGGGVGEAEDGGGSFESSPEVPAEEMGRAVAAGADTDADADAARAEKEAGEDEEEKEDHTANTRLFMDWRADHGGSWVWDPDHDAAPPEARARSRKRSRVRDRGTPDTAHAFAPPDAGAAGAGGRGALFAYDEAVPKESHMRRLDREAMLDRLPPWDRRAARPLPSRPAVLRPVRGGGQRASMSPQMPGGAGYPPQYQGGSTRMAIAGGLHLPEPRGPIPVIVPTAPPMTTLSPYSSPRRVELSPEVAGRVKGRKRGAVNATGDIAPTSPGTVEGDDGGGGFIPSPPQAPADDSSATHDPHNTLGNGDGDGGEEEGKPHKAKAPRRRGQKRGRKGSAGGGGRAAAADSDADAGKRGTGTDEVEPCSALSAPDDLPMLPPVADIIGLPDAWDYGGAPSPPLCGPDFGYGGTNSPVTQEQDVKMRTLQGMLQARAAAAACADGDGEEGLPAVPGAAKARGGGGGMRARGAGEPPPHLRERKGRCRGVYHIVLPKAHGCDKSIGRSASFLMATHLPAIPAPPTKPKVQVHRPRRGKRSLQNATPPSTQPPPPAPAPTADPDATPPPPAAEPQAVEA